MHLPNQGNFDCTLNILDAHFEIWTAKIGWTARLEYALLGGMEAGICWRLCLQKLTTISRFNAFDTISRSFSAVSDKYQSYTVFGDGRGMDKVPEAGGIGHRPTDT